MRRKIVVHLMSIAMVIALLAGCGGSAAGTAGKAESTAAEKKSIDGWTEGSAVMESVMNYVQAASDESSDAYVAPEDRIAVFDFDGTLFGELFPTYFDEWLLIHRCLHDETYEAPAEIKEYAAALEEAYINDLPEPESDLSAGQCSAEVFADLTVEEYRDYVRAFMETEAFGFDGMTYAEGFYQPMKALVEYLTENGFTVFISSGSERALVRELIEGNLDQWIPSWQVIGSTFSYAATGQGDKDGRKYDLAKDDEVFFAGKLVTKNQKTNKVFAIINEIGKAPALVFGNSSGDLAMAQYAMQNGGKAYMLLCDDTERDYGSLETAEKFKGQCDEMGIETVSMKNDFATIYGDKVVKTGKTEALAPAA